MATWVRVSLILVAAVLAAVFVLAVVVLDDATITQQLSGTAAKPNIVFVLTDDMRKDDLRFTPKTEKLIGDGGTEFKDAFVSFAMCCPSRASILTGLYPHNHGVLDNTSPNGGAEGMKKVEGSTVATWLNQAGYETFYIGKYMNNYQGEQVPPGWDRWNADSPGSSHTTDEMAREAGVFVREAQEPFFAFVATHAPHPPAIPPDRYADRFPALKAPRTPAFNEADVSDKPQWISDLSLLSRQKISGIDELYRNRARSLLAVDDLVERLVTAARERDSLGNTYFVFTSDNGFHLGEHRLKPRKSTPYKEDIRVPLLVRGPGVVATQNRQELVVNTDFAPTMAAMAGVTPGRKVDGRSFKKLLEGRTPPWRTAFLVEKYTNRVTPPYKAVHTENRILVRYEGGGRELYDLVRDSMELNNFYNTAPTSAKRRLNDRLDTLKNCANDSCRTAEN